jgi:hypothetical protein
VAASSRASQPSAASRSLPHISDEGCRPEQQEGRRELPNSVQRNSAVRCTQAWPAGLSRVLIEGAMQQAPQPGRQFMVWKSPRICRITSADFYEAL